MKLIYAIICLVAIIAQLYLVYANATGEIDSKKLSISSIIILLVLGCGFFIFWL